MVKRQKEKQYQTAREHRANSQLRSGITTGATVQRRLPFSHCALSLVPYETPLCNALGIVFETAAILPFVLHHQIDPVTGTPSDSSNFIRLHMDQNEEGAWQCPILTKPFTDHSKVIAIVQPGGKEANVYSHEAYQELNVKAKNYEDLLTGTKFDPNKDVIVLYDPADEELHQRRDINSFYHVKHARELEQTNHKLTTSQVRHSVTATRIMETIQKNKQEKKVADEKATKKRKAAEKMVTGILPAAPMSIVAYIREDGQRLRVLAEDVTGVRYTENRGAASSLTSTAVPVADHNGSREATDEEIVQAQCTVMRQRKKKGYVRLRTNQGDLTLELHCEIVPRTCVNFLGLCRAGKYDNSNFHRLIPNFMLQGGKPADDNETEESIWGGSFRDEFDDRLTHSGGGILSMANAGTNTNKRQFFITFKSCNHLDRKHTDFGVVVDGKDVLAKLERMSTDKKDRPRETITILGTDVLVDPAAEARKLEQTRLEKIAAARQQPPSKDRANDNNKSSAMAKSAKISKKNNSNDKPDVGRYLKQRLKKSSGNLQAESIGVSSQSLLPPPPKETMFGNFGGW